MPPCGMNLARAPPRPCIDLLRSSLVAAGLAPCGCAPRVTVTATAAPMLTDAVNDKEKPTMLTRVPKNTATVASTKFGLDLCINLGALAPWSTNSVSNIYCISSVLPYWVLTEINCAETTKKCFKALLFIVADQALKNILYRQNLSNNQSIHRSHRTIRLEYDYPVLASGFQRSCVVSRPTDNRPCLRLC